MSAKMTPWSSSGASSRGVVWNMMAVSASTPTRIRSVSARKFSDRTSIQE
jgi:hypothetical protein